MSRLVVEPLSNWPVGGDARWSDLEGDWLAPDDQRNWPLHLVPPQPYVSSLVLQGRAWDTDYLQTRGTQSRKKIAGVTLDLTGATLDACTVDLFLTATDEFVASVTSDAAGNYEVMTPYTGQHYVVCYKAGTPVAGTSVNTLVGV